MMSQCISIPKITVFSKKTVEQLSTDFSKKTVYLRNGDTLGHHKLSTVFFSKKQLKAYECPSVSTIPKITVFSKKKNS